MDKGKAMRLKIHFSNGQTFEQEATATQPLFVEVDGPSITVEDNGVLKQYVNVPFQVMWEKQGVRPIFGLRW